MLFIGFAGKIGWGFGYSGLWIALGNAFLGVLGVWWLMGHRIKKMSVEYQVRTMAEYFEKRYDSRFLKIFAAVAIFVFFIPYSAAVFMGLSYLFQSTFGIDYTLALVLVSSSSIAKDVYAGFINPSVSDNKLTLLMRCASAFFVALAVVLAFFKPDTIVAILGISWGAMGSVFLGPFVWGLFFKRAGKPRAIASSVLGLATCLALYFSGMPSPEAGTIGMMVSLAVNPLVSLLSPAVRVSVTGKM